MTAKGKQQHVEDSWPEKHEAWGKRQANDFCHKNDVFLWHEAIVYLKGKLTFSKEKIGKALHQLKSSQGKVYGAYSIQV